MHMGEKLQEIALKHAERFIFVGDVMLCHSADNAQINWGNQSSSIASGRRAICPGSLGEVLDVREELTAKLVLADVGTNQDQIQKRHLHQQIPGRVIQDQN